MSRGKVRIVVLGGINTDYLVRSQELPTPGQSVEGGDLFVGAGGKGANQAVAAARLGAEVSLIGCLGREARGRELVQGLRKAGVNTRHVHLKGGATSGAAIIAVDASGEKQISAALGANMALKAAEVRAAEKIIARAQVLLVNFETPMPCVLEAARIANRHGVKVVLDPAPPTKVPKELLKLVYAVRPNSDEAQKLTGVQVRDQNSARKAAKVLFKSGVAIAALQAGGQGDLALSKEEEVFVRRLKVKTVDATGAGDAFAAALAVALAEKMPLKASARFANAAAALATTKTGAQEAMPIRSAVEKLIR